YPEIAACAARLVVVLSPSWPKSLLPQQCATLELSRAQTCWSPTATLVNVTPEAETACGTLDELLSKPGSPNWPKLLSPQQEIGPPPKATPHVFHAFALPDENVGFPYTYVGEFLVAPVPSASPICPCESSPQHFIRCTEARMPHAWKAPPMSDVYVL